MVEVLSFKVAYNKSKATGLHRPDAGSDGQYTETRHLAIRVKKCERPFDRRATEIERRQIFLRWTQQRCRLRMAGQKQRHEMGLVRRGDARATTSRHMMTMPIYLLLATKICFAVTFFPFLLSCLVTVIFNSC
jgi:hypothetical protein